MDHPETLWRVPEFPDLPRVEAGLRLRHHDGRRLPSGERGAASTFCAITSRASSATDGSGPLRAMSHAAYRTNRSAASPCASTMACGPTSRTSMVRPLWCACAKPSRSRCASGHEVVPPGMAFPLCAMNICYHRDVGARGLQPADGPRIGGARSLRRHLERPADQEGARLHGLVRHHGEPFVRHLKQSNAFTNLRKEALGIQIHEQLWEYILDAPLEPGLTLPDAYAALAGRLRGFPNCVSGAALPYRLLSPPRRCHGGLAGAVRSTAS